MPVEDAGRRVFTPPRPQTRSEQTEIRNRTTGEKRSLSMEQETEQHTSMMLRGRTLEIWTDRETEAEGRARTVPREGPPPGQTGASDK